MIKRIFDIFFSLTGLFIASPIILTFLILVWSQDFKSPFYISFRVGKNNQIFKMIKLRTMIINADKNGVVSTSSNDTRITPLGHLIRKYKIDELVQLWNVFIGDMSLVGPRPNVKSETDLYTYQEKKLLKVRPGITDFSSIVFSDESQILSDSKNPNLTYNQLIRPWKSRLGLVYINNQSLILDIQLIFFTLLSIFSRNLVLGLLKELLIKINADKNLINVASRKNKLFPYPPPGSNRIVDTR